ncbi:MAG: hypothetical protein FJ249_00910 [Nitrospira sp.]|nr:hypothetical protein [Nitrospira sp.]
MTKTPHQSDGASEQPIHCPRCRGLMVVATYMDLQDDTGQIEFMAHRCMLCGEVLDPMILRNRLAERPSLLRGTKQRRFPQAVTTSPPTGQGGPAGPAPEAEEPGQRGDDQPNREAPDEA